MEYMGDRNYWEEKFHQRGESLLEPEQALVENLRYFKKGSLLDIACGDGRNTIFLLHKGFEVTGIDFSEKALERLRDFAERDNLQVQTKQVDLSKADSLENVGVFDNIVINHYRLDRTLLGKLKDHILDKGILFICGFGDKHVADSKIRKADLIQPKDFDGIKEDFDLIKFDEKRDERGCFVTYLFLKK